MVNSHLALVQSNAWHLSLPSARAAFTSLFDALLATQSRNGEVLCSAAVIVASAAEVSGLFAANQVCAPG